MSVGCVSVLRKVSGELVSLYEEAGAVRVNRRGNLQRVGGEQQRRQRRQRGGGSRLELVFLSPSPDYCQVQQTTIKPLSNQRLDQRGSISEMHIVSRYKG